MIETDTLQTVEARYKELETERLPYITRGAQCAKLTIPSLFKDDSVGNTTNIPISVQNQSIGARGVNNLANKLVLALFPPGFPFFKLIADEAAIAELTQGDEALDQELTNAFGTIERACINEFERRALRVDVHEAIRHLIVVGNVLIYTPTEGRARVFNLNKYVVSRAPDGEVIELIVKEAVDIRALPAGIAEATKALIQREGKSSSNTIHIYTRVARQDNGSWEMYQEVLGHILEDTRGTYPADKSPWLPLRTLKVDGEHYGRSYVEEYYGDLNTLEALSGASLDVTCAAARILLMVRPNSNTALDDVANAENGAVIYGDKDDVSVLQMEKYADLRIAFETIQTITARLSFAFLLNTSVQRNAERVTAEEIRLVAEELETGLGGFYSLMSQELQLPVARRLLYVTKSIPTLPAGVVEPAIVTGLDALGRGSDLVRITGFLRDVGGLANFDPSIAQRIDTTALLADMATAHGLDARKVIVPQDVFDAQQAQQQQAATFNALAPDVIKTVPNLINTFQQGEANG